MDRRFRAIFPSRSRSCGGGFSTELRRAMWNVKSHACQEADKISGLPVALVGRSTSDGMHILYVPDVGRANHSRLLHPVAEVLRAHEPAGVFDAVPIQQNRDIAGILDALKQVKAKLPGLLAGIEVRIKGLFPAVKICDFVVHKDMDH